MHSRRLVRLTYILESAADKFERTLGHFDAFMTFFVQTGSRIRQQAALSLDAKGGGGGGLAMEANQLANAGEYLIKNSFISFALEKIHPH